MYLPQFLHQNYLVVQNYLEARKHHGLNTVSLLDVMCDLKLSADEANGIMHKLEEENKITEDE